VDADSVGKARHAVADFARQAGADAGDVALAVSEAVSNAVMHAFPRQSGWPAAASRPMDRPRATGTIAIRAFADEEGIVVSVSDDGIGVTPNPDSPGLGLGLALIGSLSETVELHKEGRGTTLVMRFPIAG
jgi:serine/threonine-protein kinase RsbW/stage II sporulation protein AB (anti-sigma F factor)